VRLQIPVKIGGVIAALVVSLLALALAAGASESERAIAGLDQVASQIAAISGRFKVEA
jgi:hypothetical protein